MPQLTHRLFFALLPDAHVARDIDGVVAAIKADGEVHGRWVHAAKRHLTVHFLGNHSGSPAPLIEQACVAAHAVRHAPFEITIDHVDTFGARRQSPCVLRCSADSDRLLASFRATLGDALAGAGLASWLEQRFTPHVTIAYADEGFRRAHATTPIAWPVRDFALVESHGPAARHDVLERGPLRE